VCVCVSVCRQYQWIDDRGKKCKCTAPQYVDYVMSYSQKCISDEAIFPTKYGLFLLMYAFAVMRLYSWESEEAVMVHSC